MLRYCPSFGQQSCSQVTGTCGSVSEKQCLSLSCLAAEIGRDVAARVSNKILWLLSQAPSALLRSALSPDSRAKWTCFSPRVPGGRWQLRDGAAGVFRVLPRSALCSAGAVEPPSR